MGGIALGNVMGHVRESTLYIELVMDCSPTIVPVFAAAYFFYYDYHLWKYNVSNNLCNIIASK